MDRLNAWLRLGTAVVCFMPADGGAGDGGAAPAAAAAADAGAGAGAWTPPEGLPEQFKGTTADEVLGKILPAYADLDTRFKGARDTIAKFPAVPKSADDYAFTPTDKTKAYFPEGKDDPFMPLAREVALKSGIPAAGFSNFINGVYEAAMEKGLLAPPFSEAAEISTYAKATGLDNTATGRDLTENLAWAEGIYKQLQGVPAAAAKDVEAALLTLTDTAAGNLLIKALRGRFGDKGIALAGNGIPQGEFTKTDLQKLSADPRIDPGNRNATDPERRFDPELRKRYDASYAKIYGNNRAD